MTAQFVQPSNGLYRYWISEAKISLQIAKQHLARALRQPRVRRALADVDFLASGSGWFCITAKDSTTDLARLAKRLGLPVANAVKAFIRILNLAMLGNINANPRFNTKLVNRINYSSITNTHARPASTTSLIELARFYGQQRPRVLGVL